MASSRTALPAQLLAGRASGYELAGTRLENREAIQPGTGRGLGDIVSTIRDMAAWEREQRSPRLIKPAIAQLAQQAVKLNDGSATDHGYGWFTGDVLGLPARHHTGQTAGFVAEYLRFPERQLAIVVFANRHGAATSASRIARFVDSSLGGPPFVAASTFDGVRAARVREVMAAAARAATDWTEQWFDPNLWSRLKPQLRFVEESYSRRGALRSVTPVGQRGRQDPLKPSYRVAFERMTRLMTFEFDEMGQLKSIKAEDE